MKYKLSDGKAEPQGRTEKLKGPNILEAMHNKDQPTPLYIM